MFIKCVIFGVFIINYQVVFSLNPLPSVAENDIARTEEVIRSTTNSLFSSLGLTSIKDKPQIVPYASLHKFLVSLTLQDYTTLNVIAKLTRVDKSNTDNVASGFITTINEILEGNDLEDKLVVNVKLGQAFHFNDEIENLVFNDSNISEDERNQEVFRLLQRYSLEERNDVLSDGDKEDILFWRPENNTKSARRIYNGKRAKIKHYPFMASVQIFKRFQCAGSIIKSDLIITAASCLQLAWNNRFFRENPAFLSVRVGSSYYEVGGEVIGILEVYFYPTYDPKTLRHNIAIMRLERKIKFKRKSVKKIDFDRVEGPLPTKTPRVTIVGWGAKTSSNIIHNPWENKIRFSDLHVYPLRECQIVYSKQYVTRRNFCAGFMSKGSGACNRDLGGPGIVRGLLTGIISFGAPVCGTPDAPTVFTKVGYYTDWIEDIIEQEVPWKYKRTTKKPHKFTYDPNPPEPTVWAVSPMISTKSTYITETEVASTVKLPSIVVAESILMTKNDAVRTDDAINNKVVNNRISVKKEKTEKENAEKENAEYSGLAIDAENIINNADNSSLSDYLRQILDSNEDHVDDSLSAFLKKIMNSKETTELSIPTRQTLPRKKIRIPFMPQQLAAVTMKPFKPQTTSDNNLVYQEVPTENPDKDLIDLMFVPAVTKGYIEYGDKLRHRIFKTTTKAKFKKLPQPLFFKPAFAGVTRMMENFADENEVDYKGSPEKEVNTLSEVDIVETTLTTKKYQTESKKPSNVTTKINNADLDAALEEIIVKIVDDADILQYLQNSTLTKSKPVKNKIESHTSKEEPVLTLFYVSDNETENSTMGKESKTLNTNPFKIKNKKQNGIETENYKKEKINNTNKFKPFANQNKLSGKQTNFKNVQRFKNQHTEEIQETINDKVDTEYNFTNENNIKNQTDENVKVTKKGIGDINSNVSNVQLFNNKNNASDMQIKNISKLIENKFKNVKPFMEEYKSQHNETENDKENAEINFQHVTPFTEQTDVINKETEDDLIDTESYKSPKNKNSKVDRFILRPARAKKSRFETKKFRPRQQQHQFTRPVNVHHYFEKRAADTDAEKDERASMLKKYLSKDEIYQIVKNVIENDESLDEPIVINKNIS